MSLVIYNSQTQKKEVFVPHHQGEVRMYVCGPTVYDFLHVGNFRGAIFFNLVRNWLEKSGYKVTYVYNYTDVDDKIIKRAQEEGVSPEAISDRFIKEFEKDFSALKLKPHSHNPKVTEHMEQILILIQDLIAKGKAYAVDGDVYFDVRSFADYGKLSHKKMEDLEAGYRIEVDERKKFSADFALWKKAKPGEPHWSSPWSEGRPGWHIECSAMSRALLGETLDIHGGGLDLLFPHHENEVAQSEGASGQTYVKYWMHNNMITFGNQKMSKSLGNVRSGRSFLEEYNGEILKYLMLSVHYRSTSDFSDQGIENAIGHLGRFYSSLSWAKKLSEGAPLAPIPQSFEELLDQANQKFEQALNDDFNTPEVIAVIYEVMRQFNQICRAPGKMTAEKQAVAQVYSHWLRSKGEILALFQEPPSEFLLKIDDMLLNKKGISRLEVDQIVHERQSARTAKDFKKADELRVRLQELGISVQDTMTGSEWEVQK